MSFLAAEFAMKDLGPLSYFFGIAVPRHAGGLFLYQHKYVEEIIERADMTSCKPATTLVDTKAKMSVSSGSPHEDPTYYRSLAGALQYHTLMRQDISYTVQQGILDYSLHLYKSSISGLISYIEADWGGCPDTRRSTSGYCVFLRDNLISWSSKRQLTLSRSSAEAEYRGIANVVSKCWI
ncbi:uncharacterized mitochondrial protein AtMg00810-like [Zingiber officinale]|uniref:uncharacterized mitochondrial protein AtMg00810-like n=1 Tax=Zingiber officinale TaxID=94328 RepID=UPI001C4CE76E|nr:uncharacterized mitochondrial protein AtMg00810-like [Zingiber officinale]